MFVLTNFSSSVKKLTALKLPDGLSGTILSKLDLRSIELLTLRGVVLVAVRPLLDGKLLRGLSGLLPNTKGVEFRGLALVSE